MPDNCSSYYAPTQGAKLITVQFWFTNLKTIAYPDVIKRGELGYVYFLEEMEERIRGAKEWMRKGRVHFLLPSTIDFLGKFEKKEEVTSPAFTIILVLLHMEQGMKKGYEQHGEITHPRHTTTTSSNNNQTTTATTSRQQQAPQHHNNNNRQHMYHSQ